MTVSDIERIMEDWAPLWTAWDRDHVGLQLGRRNQRVSKVMVALEVTDGIVEEAIRRKIDLLVTHHPPFFHPVTSVIDADQTGNHILTLAQHNIAVYSSHTNLDSARGGVSFALARALGIRNARMLQPLEGKLSKIIVFAPATHVEQIAARMSANGAGTIGDYEACSFRTEGIGTFKGTADSRPFLGKKASYEHAKEVRLEMVTPSARVADVVQGIKEVHPYEEVAYDVYPVATPSVNFGMGAIGSLARETTLRAFLRTCKRSLGAAALRYTGTDRQNVRTVAVCGGSGSDLLGAAVRAGADVFVTADVRYHTFHAAQGRIALVDAGHWETEHCVLEPVRKRLLEATQRLNQRVFITLAHTSTNPVQSI